MPSPLGHLLMGYIIHDATARPAEAKRWQTMAFALVAANVPDFDFIPGLLIGMPRYYHRGITHSLGFAILFALVTSLLLRGRKRDSLGRYVVLSFGLYCSHLVLDTLSRSRGVPLFWPLSNDYVVAPFAFFPGLQGELALSLDAIVGLFSLHNVVTLSTELFFLLPLMLLLRLWKLARYGAPSLNSSH